MSNEIDLPISCRCTECQQERVREAHARRAERKEEIILARQLFQTPVGALAKQYGLTPKTIRRILEKGGVS